MAMCFPGDYSCAMGEIAGSVAGNVIENMATAVTESYEKAVASLGTIWVHIGTPKLSEKGSSESVLKAGTAAPDSGEITNVLGHVMWFSLAVAVLSLFILGALIATRMRTGEGVAAVGRVGLVLASVVFISGASALVTGLMPAKPNDAAGATLFLQSGLWWYMGAAAVLSVIIGGARMAWEQRAEPGRETVKSLLTLVVVAGAGVTIVGMLVGAADSFSVWLINSSLGCDVTQAGSACFSQNMSTLLKLTSQQAGGLGSLLIIILGLIAILASAFQIVLMVARGGMLVILTGILPLSASFTNTEMGKAWFKKCIAWLVAFILYKPAAAIVYSAAFQLAGSDVYSDDGTGLLAVLTGLMLMIIALFAMPALMRFVTPMVGAMAGGAGGAMAAGAMAALPSGAASVGRLASGSGSGSGSTGASGGDGSSGSTGSQGPTGGRSDGSTGAQTAANPAPQQTGSGAASSAGASAGAGGGAAGGAAAGGATAAGAAAGPVGMAAGAALDVAKKAGQAAAGAARSVGKQSTEGGGPDGSR